MANHNFPPGMPFPFPFPQMQQPPSGAHQDGQQQHAPPPPPGWNMPGLQQLPPQPYAPQPGHAENQSNLPQFPSAALNWPPQIPPEWLQLMQSSMQSGMIPPPIPGLSFPPPSLPHTPQAPATPTAFPPPFTPQSAPAHPSVAPMGRVQEVADSEREDGEVSDAEGSLQAPIGQAPSGIAMRQRYPEPPRSALQSTATPTRIEDAYNPDKPSAGQTARKPSAVKDAPQTKTPANEVDLVQQQREEAKQFIRLLNANNISYHTLAKENIDLELLRAMYRSMNLPSEPEPIPPPKTNGAAAAKSQASATASSAPQKTVPPVATNIATAQSAAPSPVDRKDYLARLQAAKLARQSGPVKASPPQKSPPAAVASSATGISTPQSIMTPTRKPPVTDEQKARQTELIKQRLEALKAQSKQGVATASTAPNPRPSQSTAQQPQMPGSGTSAPQTPATSLPGIPGLFMNTTANTTNGSLTPSRQPPAVPQKRPAPSDTSVSTPRGSVTPYHRPFGQSPHAQQEESMIIEVSDDESNGSDMDIDDDQAPSGSSDIRQAPVSIPGFPPRQPLMPAAASAVSTPGPQTPATLARTGELSTKEQELAALKLTLKKKLAEQKRIKEAAEAATAAALVHRSQPTPSKPVAAAASLPSGSVTTTAQTTLSQGDSSRDRKRRRRTEIQEQLPTLDDEIANNEAEMARLAKDLERLKTNNERIMQDKQRLTKELEELGIDTEGMSHADMKATKDEIERAKSPEVGNVSKTVDGLPQELVSNEESTASTSDPNDGNIVVARESVTLPAPDPIESQPERTRYGFLPGLGQSAPEVHKSAVETSVSRPAQEQHQTLIHDALPTSELGKPVEAAGHVSDSNDRTSATPMDDEEDFYSPPPLIEDSLDTDTSVAHPAEAKVDRINATAPSPSEEGEVEMSESSEEDDEEEYEPEEPIVEDLVAGSSSLKNTVVEERVAAPTSQQDRPQVEQPQSLGQSQVSTEDEEAYEPPDIDEEMTEVVAETDVSQPAATQLQAPSSDDVDDGAMDIATSSSEDSDDSESESEEGSQSEFEGSGLSTRAAQSGTNIADDLAPELQPRNSVAIVPAVEQPPYVAAVEDEPEPEPPKFTPYESPLRLFKSYRYHPNFSQDVDGGFLSMTYSHQIDPEKPLCPFESAGGSCNDPECPNQHFRGMGITGEKLLVQLGTANPGKTQEEKQQWNDGLRSVLKDLRQKNIKDPNGIAREIAKYRRQFLNDDTRVVNL